MFPLIRLLGEVFTLAIFFAAPSARDRSREHHDRCPERY
jgi:hypothetical protein